MAFGDFTVVRSTPKRVTNSSGVLAEVAVNTPAFEFNADGSYKGLLVEPAATNLTNYSEQFDNAVWSPASPARVTISANTTTDPTGGTTADTMTETTENSTHRVIYTYTHGASIANLNWSLSAYYKIASGSPFAHLALTDSSGSDQIRAWFNLTNGTVGTVENISDGSGATASMTSVGNGWYRCVLSGIASTNPAPPTTQLALFVGMSDSNGSQTYTGSTSRAVFLWGAQLELGSVATSYIPTVASTVTRTADDISLSSASSLIGQVEGTIFVDMTIFRLPVDSGIFGVQHISNSFVIRLGSTGTGVYAQSFDGTNNLFFESTSYTLGTSVKVAFAYKAGSYAYYINGVQIATGSNATAIPACDNVFLAKGFASGNDTVANFESFALFPTRLSNSQLESLTTL